MIKNFLKNHKPTKDANAKVSEDFISSKMENAISRGAHEL